MLASPWLWIDSRRRLDGKDKLLEIMKEQHIAKGFPIKCKTEEEAIEILEILLDSKASNG